MISTTLETQKQAIITDQRFFKVILGPPLLLLSFFILVKIVRFPFQKNLGHCTVINLTLETQKQAIISDQQILKVIFRTPPPIAASPIAFPILVQMMGQELLYIYLNVYARFAFHATVSV